MNARAVLRAADAVRTTWGFSGGRRRLAYEWQRRRGAVRRAEETWLDGLTGCAVRISDAPLLAPPRPPTAPAAQQPKLYGAIPIERDWVRSWHRHPLTGRFYPPDHWSELSEKASTDDIKDVWELGRMSWLGAVLQATVEPATANQAAEACWGHVESFVGNNPPYRGPQWMCGQESALRGIGIICTCLALRGLPPSTPDREAMAAQLVAQTVGRVSPTLDYALSQRNNHAVSEAAFLWSAAILVEGIPDADALELRGRKALEEAVADQWYDDGAYAQHSPTYQRLALHALLWVMAVSRAAGVAEPKGVRGAVTSSLKFLSRIMDSSTGRVPNLGGNDGAHLFQLTPQSIRDFRPLLVHAAAALGAPTAIEPGPWDLEAAWFRLEPRRRAAIPTPHASIAHHVHRGPSSHLVLRAGPIRHRPAHADQLHVDLWLGGENVTCDPGSFRYTAPLPWGNALADETVHNVVRVATEPQARRRGRFFWSEWVTARVVATLHSPDKEATLVELVLPSGTALRRLAVRLFDCHIVMDHASAPAIVRWNLPLSTALTTAAGRTGATGKRWRASFRHGGEAVVRSPVEHDPTSGWWSPLYSVRDPLVAIELTTDGDGRASATFMEGTSSAAYRDEPLNLFELRGNDDTAAAVAALQDAP